MNGRARRARVLLIQLLLLFLGFTAPGPARAQPAPPPEAAPPAPAGAMQEAPGQEAPVQEAPVQEVPGQIPGLLMVRMLLPAGVPSAALSLNGAFVAPLPGGVLAAPLSLLPGGYHAQVSAPGARSFEAPLQILPGQLIELTGALQPETAAPPPYFGGTRARPPTPSAPLSARRVGRKIVLGVVLGVVGLVVTAGIVAAAVCGAGKCSSSSSHHHWD